MKTVASRFASALTGVCLLLSGCGSYSQPTVTVTVSSSTVSAPPTGTYSFSALANVLIDLKLNSDGPDSAGGVAADGSFTNGSYEVIKYVRIHVIPFNAVGDQVASEIGDKSETWLKVTGPIDHFNDASPTWDPIWYNSTITELRIDSVEVEYMSGTIEEFAGPPRAFR